MLAFMECPRARGGPVGQQCRPCGRRDPYAVPVVLRDAVGRHQSQNYSLWLWVPACAGTTDGEWRVVSSGRGDNVSVVPADAGTHTPCRSCWEMLLDDINRKTTPCGYGSPRSRGRRVVSGEWG